MDMYIGNDAYTGTAYMKKMNIDTFVEIKGKL